LTGFKVQDDMFISNSDVTLFTTAGLEYQILAASVNKDRFLIRSKWGICDRVEIGEISREKLLRELDEGSI